MVALDDLAGDVQGFDAVGVDGSLCEPACAFDLACFLVEDFDEVAADDLALLLGVADSGEVCEELGGGIYAADVQPEAFIVVEDIAELVLAEQAVVHEDTGEAVADGAVEEYGGNAAIDSS